MIQLKKLSLSKTCLLELPTSFDLLVFRISAQFCFSWKSEIVIHPAAGEMSTIPDGIYIFLTKLFI